MIPNNSNVATVETNFDSQSVQFSLDETALVHLAQVLSNLYENIEGSIARELITNALDSHVDAGQTLPVEVDTPTSMSPYFKVRDHGVGLSLDDLVNIYSKYGASTKRKSNKTTGSLGLGSKSPLAYCSSFTVTSVHDGMRILAAVTINEEGIGVLNIIDTVTTTESNGVEISIPAKVNSSFKYETEQFARFVDSGKLLVNGREHSLTLEKATDGIYFFEKESVYSKDRVVMGGVSYPVSQNLSGGLLDRSMTGVAAFVPMGSVNFTPNRESLMYTDLTKKTLQELTQRFKDAIKETIRKDIEDAPTHADAMRRKSAWRNKFNTYSGNSVMHGTYKGMTIPSGTVLKPDNSGYETTLKWNRNASRYAVQNNSTITYDTFATGLFVTNYPYVGTVSANNKAKIRKYITDNSLGCNGAVFFFADSNIPGKPWGEPTFKVDWDDIKNVRLNTAARRGQGFSRDGGYDVWNGSRFALNHDLKATDDIIYLSPSDQHDGNKWSECDKAIKIVAEHHPNAKIVSVGKNRIDKLKRNAASGQHIDDTMDTIFNSLTAKVTDDDKRIYWIQDNVDIPTIVRRMSSSDIHDPELAALLKTLFAENWSPALDKVLAMRYNGLKVEDFLDSFPKQTVLDVNERYPLLTSAPYLTIGPKTTEEFLFYINAKYDSLTQKGV